MRAIEFVGPRKIVLRDDLPIPAPNDGEVLVRCSHVALCGTNMGPYLHDGRLLTLEDTVEFFNMLCETMLTDQEKQDLVAFMRCL